MAPEMGYRAASSAKFSATMNWPRNTSGQVKKNAGPPKLKPSANSWKIVVRIETNENPAANEANLPSERCSCCSYPSSARSEWSLRGGEDPSGAGRVVELMDVSSRERVTAGRCLT